MVGSRKCYLCDKKADKEKKVSLYLFPKRSSNEVLFGSWLHVLNLNERDEVKNLRICSGHFTPNDFCNPWHRVKLKSLAVPSVRVPNPLPVPNQEAKPEPPWQENIIVAEEAMDASPSISLDEVVVRGTPSLGTSSNHTIYTDGLAQPAVEPELDPRDTTPVKILLSDIPNRICVEPRYVTEVDPLDVSTPQRATKTVRFVEEVDLDKPVKIRRLQQDSRLLEAQNLSLHHDLANLHCKMGELSRRKANVSAEGATVASDTGSMYNLLSLRKDLIHAGSPKNWAFSFMESRVILFYVGDRAALEGQKVELTRSICVKEDMTIEVRGRGKLCTGNLDVGRINCMKDLRVAMGKVAELNICGVQDGSCCGTGFLESYQRQGKCPKCSQVKKNKSASARRATQQLQKKEALVQFKRKLIRVIEHCKLDQTLEDVELLKSECAKVKKTSLEVELENFPKVQQEAIRACLNASKCTGPSGRKYTNLWVLECVLLRIKSRKAYLHIRNHNILPLPTLFTLEKYIEKMEPSYGFNKEMLIALRAKAEKMSLLQLRGTLVIAEMKLSEALAFDSTKFLFRGFTDLGDHTPENVKNTRGDHALVLMFQPFCGSDVQTVGAFLSNGCANSTILHKLITEAIILLENCGLCIDVVTTDGSTWDRAMWKLFGLSGNDCSCAHPCDDGSDRRLWFCSDFHHLVKNFTNFFVESSETWTPEGVIKKAHYVAVLDCDKRSGLLGLKIAHKLQKEALDPKFYKKMNVDLALQLFRPTVAAAMELYRGEHFFLDDCDPTVNFINMFSEVIAAMSSRCRKDGLSLGSESYKVISDFIEYLQDWEIEAKENDFKFMSPSTYGGFIVTLKSTLELCTLLTEQCDFEYLMTARLNQDALKGFLGMVLGAGCSHDHPDAILFIQIYQLLSFYSLVKPPRGSNVEGVEIFESLLNHEEVTEGVENEDEWEEILDLFILKGPNSNHIHREGDEHDYAKRLNVPAYLGGFVAHRFRRWTKCDACLATLTKQGGDKERGALIPRLSKGYLLYPSDELHGLLCACERAILKTVGMEEMNAYTFLRIADNILAESAPSVGCSEHQGILTKRVTNYYTVCWSRILARMYNKAFDEKRQDELKLRKQAKF